MKVWFDYPLTFFPQQDRPSSCCHPPEWGTFGIKDVISDINIVRMPSYVDRDLGGPVRGIIYVPDPWMKSHQMLNGK